MQMDATLSADAQKRIHWGGQNDILALDSGFHGHGVKRRRWAPAFTFGVFGPVALGGRPGFVATEVDPISLGPILCGRLQSLPVEIAVFPKNTFFSHKAKLHHPPDSWNDDDFGFAIAEEKRI